MELCTGEVLRTNSLVGSVHYLAPEVLVSAANEGYDAMADWWAFGVLLYDMLVCLSLPSPVFLAAFANKSSVRVPSFPGPHQRGCDHEDRQLRVQLPQRYPSTPLPSFAFFLR